MKKIMFSDIFDRVMDLVEKNDLTKLKTMAKEYHFKEINDSILFVPRLKTGYVVSGNSLSSRHLKNAIKEDDFFYLDDNVPTRYLGDIEFDIEKENIDESWCVSNFDFLRRGNFFGSMNSTRTNNAVDANNLVFSTLTNKNLSIIEKIILGSVQIPNGPRTKELQHSHDNGYVMPSKYQNKNILKKFRIIINPEIDNKLCKSYDHQNNYRGIIKLF